jgi:hypothetical protein
VVLRELVGRNKKSCTVSTQFHLWRRRIDEAMLVV